MKADSLRNFTVRFLESALRRVESTAKPFYGGRLSTGEAIRRLAEERLDEIERFSPKESTRSALLRILSEWRSGQIIAVADLALLGQLANQAYQRCRQDFVSRTLLIANARTFRDAVGLAARGKPREIQPEERYLLGNLSTRKEIQAKTLAEYVDRWIELLPEHPSPSQAEFASRNLLAYLRDEAFPDEEAAAKALNLYLPSLLQVAVHAHWQETREPLIDQAPKSPLSPASGRTVSSLSADGIVIRSVLDDYGISASIELTEQNSIVCAANFADLDDLSEVTRIAAAGTDVRGSAFAWSIEGEKGKRYRLSTDRASWLLNAAQFASFAECLEAAFREPPVVALVERLRYVYGRI